jgi:hypothetical protein
MEGVEDVGDQALAGSLAVRRKIEGGVWEEIWEEIFASIDGACPIP